jgi:ubiquinone biosynthesis monooxygenase Coq7
MRQRFFGSGRVWGARGPSIPNNALHQNPPSSTLAAVAGLSSLLNEKNEWIGDKVLIQNLRSNHAGETGAVFIYKGAVAAMEVKSSRYSPDARSFARTHLQTEMKHLDYFDRLLDHEMKSMLLPLWRLSGFCLGFFPTLIFGEKALFITVEAVETFVEVHYLEQINLLEQLGLYPNLASLLKHCCEEEVNHKEDAMARWLKAGQSRSWSAALWAWVVEIGSRIAVFVCKRI